MEIKPEHQQMFNSTLELADRAFWAEVAKSFPEAKTGDFPPDLVFARGLHNEEDVLWWLHYNAPGLVEE